MIGQHAMAGVLDGNLHHTQNSRAVESYTLNGRPIELISNTEGLVRVVHYLDASRGLV